VNDQPIPTPLDDSEPVDVSPRSPVRPTPPQEAVQQPDRSPMAQAPTNETPKPSMGQTNPNSALTQLRQKMEKVANEYAAGKINRAQFNAVYGRYSEQRAIIERLIERNPDSKAWKQVMGTGGHTSFLRQHFEAQPMYYAVFRHNVAAPIMIGGKHTPRMEQLAPVLKALWSMANRPKVGLARKPIGDGEWLVLAMGEQAVTLVMFNLEPSAAQASLVRDLHADFERANQAALERATSRLDKMVYPQRALVEGNF
jgi:hypothetical protein